MANTLRNTLTGLAAIVVATVAVACTPTTPPTPISPTPAHTPRAHSLVTITQATSTVTPSQTTGNPEAANYCVRVQAPVRAVEVTGVLRQNQDGNYSYFPLEKAIVRAQVPYRVLYVPDDPNNPTKGSFYLLLKQGVAARVPPGMVKADICPPGLKP